MGGYRLEYASSARAGCKGPKPCTGTKIAKGELRFGTVVDFQGKTSFAWRHFYCITTKVWGNVKNEFESAAELDGFDELTEEDQDRINAAFEAGEIPDHEIPASLKAARENNEDSPKKKAAAKAKKAAEGEEGEEDDEEKPTKKPAKKIAVKKVGVTKATPKKSKKKVVSDDSEEEDAVFSDSEEEKPKKKSKAKPKGKAGKKDADSEDEDFEAASEDVAPTRGKSARGNGVVRTFKEADSDEDEEDAELPERKKAKVDEEEANDE